MSLIMRAAGFRVSRCGRHGWVTTGDGTQSIDVYSKEAAREIVKGAVDDGKITEIELPELHRQISESGLPESMSVADIASAMEEMFDRSVAEKEREELRDSPNQVN